MMVTLEQVKMGICRYVDAEIMSKVSGLNKWFMGAIITSIPAIVDHKYTELKSTLKIMSLTNDDDHIDIEKAEDALLQSAMKYGNVSVSLGGMSVTMNSDDIRKVVAYISQ